MLLLLRCLDVRGLTGGCWGGSGWCWVCRTYNVLVQVGGIETPLVLGECCFVSVVDEDWA